METTHEPPTSPQEATTARDIPPAGPAEGAATSPDTQLALTTLPVETQLHIFSHLDFPSALVFCRLSRYHRATFHPRMLPAREKQRFLSLVENQPRNGGLFRSKALGCFACCRVRPAACFEKRQIWPSRERLPGPRPPPALYVDT